VWAAALYIHFKSGAGHKFFERRVGGRRPVSGASSRPECGPGSPQTREVIKATVCSGAESRRAVIYIEDDAVEGLGRFADDIAYISQRYADARIRQRLRGQRERRVSIPRDHSG
jgi:hypothetical protein